MTAEKQNTGIPGLEIRFTLPSDANYMLLWLNDPKILRGFPIQTEAEIRETVNFWVGFYRYHSSLTAVYQGEVAGVATLILNPYVKVSHHALISIIVGERFRSKGLGTALINNLIHLAKTRFKLEVLYLEVYESNPAIHLYERFGFTEVGRQRHFYKDAIGYLAKITMEKNI
ncbi:Spermine/spermidine acetyltransferase,ribosomal-protein-alanine N-acetyltransferase,Predicted acetyltransferase,ribosomal-protein-alanine acetyltransferase,Acetyltransferase (GNAT) family [Chlamydia serpentis]|uniref:Spermine/spermidine acetyltransferase,ribosomal-protein-alanine N-acetyltransferase,Predicted acetyltransferase,ribosomal-protein-alanine acetyltransferase,Acetyltransferase (GNAT) family n=1 Tax=Chlamydia serpentis TaxID=1967782 RepID=A0A2R8FB91_9CHLA|nr:GNAT family N-acetyltransferase [Chlamydia serpentis]SPN73694.1 Spermine/spermidine acetyltransferase,ribosomal-protein-alanine N-acetyltransferase,Predicted acetyltransferase,ribosomal-protein-alanine acetyltransferase,Acetyltransferase (GNAT) family [Chlamydia serpentis]